MIKLTLLEGTIYLLNFLVYLYRYNVPKARIVWGKLLYILDFQKFIFHPLCFFSVQHLKTYLLGHTPLKKKKSYLTTHFVVWLIYVCLFWTQIPEQFGPIRTVAEGKGDVVLIGTTRNFVLQGTLSGDFFPITQVNCCLSSL